MIGSLREGARPDCTVRRRYRRQRRPERDAGTQVQELGVTVKELDQWLEGKTSAGQLQAV